MKLENKSIVNTDQEGMYYSHEYMKISQEFKFIRSISYKGDCRGNSPIKN